MRNIKLTIEYDGAAYCGWQVQPNGTTVQAVLKAAIEKMTGHAVNLIGASRTDAGVHALGQVASFKTQSRIPCNGFLKGLNSMLPDDISIRGCEEVSDDFHAKRLACGKHYRYLVAFGGSRSALLRNRVWYVGAQYVAEGFSPPRTVAQDFSPANVSRSIVKKLNKAAQPLVGVHDFSAFCGSGDCNKSKVREIYSIKVHVLVCHPRESGNRVHSLDSRFCVNDMVILAIDIKGKGFLKYMVRNIVGTLIRPRGPNSIFKPDPKIYKILRSRDRRKAGVTAPACGLYLVKVFY